MRFVIAVNVQLIGDGKAAPTGDFVLTAEEVNHVTPALPENSIPMTALRNHMLAGPAAAILHPRLSADDAGTLAKRLRAALDHVKAAKN